MRKTSALRSAAAVMVLAVAMMALTGAGTSAATPGLPAILSGKADSQALYVKITLPSLEQLQAILTKVTGQPVALPDVDLPVSVPTVIEQKISLNNAAVQ